MWQSHADPDGDGYSYSNGDAYADSDYSDAQTTSDTATSPIGLSGFVREGTRERKLASPPPVLEGLDRLLPWRAVASAEPTVTGFLPLTVMVTSLRNLSIW